jgi:hypothetical protein
MNALTFYAQRLPARDEYTHRVGLTQDSIGEGRGGLDDVFAIVEDDQHGLVSRVLDDRRHWSTAACTISSAEWTALRTCVFFSIGAKSTKNTSSADFERSLSTTPIAKVVLPMPPGPEIVTRQSRDKSRKTVSILLERPTIAFACIGSLDAARLGVSGIVRSSRWTGAQNE